MKALHSLTNSCDFADLKFRLAEMRGTYHFGALSMGYVSFWRPYTSKKPLLFTKTREVFLLYLKIEYGIIISTTRDLRRNNMNENKNNKNSKKGDNSSGLAIGMCIGISIGTAIGAATHNIGLWMPIGLSAGLCLGIVLGHNSKDDKEDGTDDKQ